MHEFMKYLLVAYIYLLVTWQPFLWKIYILQFTSRCRFVTHDTLSFCDPRNVVELTYVYAYKTYSWNMFYDLFI